MKLDRYQELAEETAGAGMEDLYYPMQRVQCDFHIDVDRVLCSVLGVSGEAGELANKVKKLVYHAHYFEQPKIREEIGDVLWYLAELCTAFNWSLEQVARDNICKLAKRYPDGFTVEDSINRGPGEE